MQNQLAQFAQFDKSTSPVAFNVRSVSKDDEISRYGVFCHAEHQLYKVIDTGEWISDACAIADIIICQHHKLDAEEFADWIEQQFPEDVNMMSRQQIDSYFA